MRDDLLDQSTSDSVMAAYCSLMEELKARHATVIKILTDAKEGKYAFPPYLMGEFCFLQLRMMCEVIALGCLVVHGDIQGTRTQKMRQASGADWIINRLSKLHPSFYPMPGRQVVDPVTRIASIEPTQRPYLTKTDFLRLYAECGSILHRGALKNVLSNDPRPMDLVKALKYTGQIARLLDFHRIPLLKEGEEIWITMTGKDGGKVQWMPMLFTPDA